MIKIINLQFDHDPDADTAYIYLNSINANEITDTIIANESGEFVNGDINLDLDKDKRLRGIEVLDASKILPKELLDKLSQLQ